MRPIAPAAALLLVLPCVAGLAQVVDPRVEARRLIADAVAQLENGRHSEAIETLTRAGKLDPKNVHIPFYLAQCELNLAIRERYPERLERAREYLRRAKSIDATFGGIAFVRGLVEIEARKYEDAVQGFREALTLKFEPLKSQGNLAHALFLLGTELAKREDSGERERAIAILEEARRRFRDLKDDLRIGVDQRRSFAERWVQSQLNLAAVHRAAKDYPEARTILEDLIRVEPRDAGFRYRLAVLFGEERRWKEALANHEKALELAPGFPEPHLKMGWIYSQMRDSEKAEDHLRIYLESVPDSWEAHRTLGDHYLSVDRVEEAVEEYERCVELDRRAIEAVKKLSEALRKVPDRAAADKWSAEYDVLKAEREKKKDE